MGICITRSAWIGLLFCACIGGRLEAADIQALDVYGEIALRSRFVDDDVFVYSQGPVIQPNVGLEHRPSGCFVELWANIGLSDSAGDEVDYIAGCQRDTLGGELAIYASYYDLVGIDDGMFGVSAEASFGNLALHAHYYRPKRDDEDDGIRLVGAYSTSLSPDLSLTTRLTYDSGPYDGVRPIISASATASLLLTERLALSLAAIVPVVAWEPDGRESQFVGSAIFQF